MEMQLILKSDLSQELPKAIEFNFEELKSELTDMLASYQGIVLDESQIKRGKADRATLNKLITALENARKAVKKQCLKPYEEFEMKVKELVALVNEPKLFIDEQLKNYEEQRRQERYAQCKDLLEQNLEMPILSKLVLEKNISLLNASTNINECINIAKQINADVATIKQITGEPVSDMLLRYMDTLCLNDAVEFAKKIEEQRKGIEVPRQQNDFAENGEKNNVESEQEFSVTLQVTATKIQLKGLKSFLDFNKINYQLTK